MRRTTLSALSALLVVTLACGEGTGVDADDLVGTWNASKMEFANAANPSQKTDVIALGATFTITLTANKTYTATFAPPDAAPEVTSGTWTSSVDVLTIAETGDPFSVQFDFALSGTTLTLSGGGVEFDFDGTGEVPAELDMILTKQ